MFLFIFIAVLLAYLFGAAFLFKVFAVSLIILVSIPVITVITLGLIMALLT